MARCRARVPPLVVDVRTAKEWQPGHIDGAMHIPLGDLARRAAEIAARPHRGDDVRGGLPVLARRQRAGARRRRSTSSMSPAACRRGARCSRPRGILSMPARDHFEALRQSSTPPSCSPDTAAIAQQVKSALQQALRGGLELPPAFRQPRPDTYARRLLHRDPDGRYTAVVMTWGPGQGTPLHDHAGIWCVECVVDGEMEVRQYDLVEQRGESITCSRRSHASRPAAARPAA